MCQQRGRPGSASLACQPANCLPTKASPLSNKHRLCRERTWCLRPRPAESQRPRRQPRQPRRRTSGHMPGPAAGGGAECQSLHAWPAGSRPCSARRQGQAWACLQPAPGAVGAVWAPSSRDSRQLSRSGTHRLQHGGGAEGVGALRDAERYGHRALGPQAGAEGVNCAGGGCRPNAHQQEGLRAGGGGRQGGPRGHEACCAAWRALAACGARHSLLCCCCCCCRCRAMHAPAALWPPSKRRRRWSSWSAQKRELGRMRLLPRKDGRGGGTGMRPAPSRAPRQRSPHCRSRSAAGRQAPRGLWEAGVTAAGI